MLLCTEILDLLWYVFQRVRIESSGVTRVSLSQGIEILSQGIIPFSHGLFMSLVWSTAAGLIALLFYRDLRISGIIGLTVFSHWALDFIVHPHELPLLFNSSPTVGLGLWTSGQGFILALILEFTLFAGGLAIYLSYRRRAERPAQAGKMVR